MTLYQHESRYAVRMGMSVAESAALSDLLLRLPDDVVEVVLDQLWLRSIFSEQLRRTGLSERDGFTARAERILERLDPQEKAA